MEQSKIRGILFLGLLVIGLFLPLVSRAEEKIAPSMGQTVYVPVYSHIYSGNKEYPFLLTATLSIRNVDLKHKIIITMIDYYNTEGNFVRHFLNEPLTLNKLVSTRYVVKQDDKSGGSGAKFIVKWQAEQAVNPPIIESVMIGSQQQGVSFSSRGQVISTAD
jgi:hypothetical protein